MRRVKRCYEQSVGKGGRVSANVRLISRLAKSSEIQLVQKTGIKRNHALVGVSVKSAKSRRATVVASKSVGSAVMRNRAKRRLRALLDAFAKKHTDMPVVDIVLTARAKTVTAEAGELAAAVEQTLLNALASIKKQAPTNSQTTA